MTQREIENVTNEILRALVPAPAERKVAALMALRGETVVERSHDPETGPGLKAKPTGPLLLGMLAGAKVLGVSRATLWRMMKAGTIGKVELFPGSFRLRREDLEAFAAGRARKDARGQKSEVIGRLEDARTENPRFKVYLGKADGGDENAAGDLFREFQYDHAAGRFTDDGGRPVSASVKATPDKSGRCAPHHRGDSVDAEVGGAE